MTGEPIRDGTPTSCSCASSSALVRAIPFSVSFVSSVSSCHSALNFDRLPLISAHLVLATKPL